MASDLQGVLLSPWALGLLGLCIGSFLNVVIHRLPQMMERAWRLESAELLGVTPPELPALTLAKPASRCPQCGHRIRWFENVPVLSWLLLRGRCSACKTPISPRYPLFEIATGLLFALLAWRFGAQPTVLAWCAFVAVLLALSGIDWDTTLLPDSLTLPLLWAGLVAAALGWTLPLSTSVWGAVFGYLSLWSVYWLFKLTTGKEGMGAGDFKLLAALGAWLGWQMLLPIVLGASLIGAVVGIAMKLGGALHEGRYVPFGPFLAGAGLVVLYAGSERVMGWLGWA
ncbi:prepilin peptidase [Methylibium petroleiphilum]|uniref:prepilin peptidase n=1 Tax=Methylibium petroleiphilum TaxID=105560 RepID=UPI001AC38764|nr:A24 family peptidase [Methylibium petroleiphilum]MBN9204335.1 prepilin peptidase [Methylibium petroleiphilum]